MSTDSPQETGSNPDTKQPETQPQEANGSEREQTSGLPLFYQDITPLSSQAHGKSILKNRKAFPFARDVNIVPLTTDEFIIAQRHYPILFENSPDAAPLALVGLGSGNLCINDEGVWEDHSYIPAFVRRYPFILARLNKDQDKLSLCYDQTSNVLEQGEAGQDQSLFDTNDPPEPTELTKSILKFCEDFEQSLVRTQAFMKELEELELLREGELTLDIEGTKQKIDGFRMINREKYQELPGDKLRKMRQSGMLDMIYAHFFSLTQLQSLIDRYSIRKEAAAKNDSGEKAQAASQ